MYQQVGVIHILMETFVLFVTCKIHLEFMLKHFFSGNLSTFAVHFFYIVQKSCCTTCCNAMGSRQCFPSLGSSEDYNRQLSFEQAGQASMLT